MNFDILRLRNSEWWYGLMLAFPLAVPGPPWYWLALSVFLLAALKLKFDTKKDRLDFTLVIISLAVLVASNFFSDFQSEIRTSTLIGSWTPYLFLLFGRLVRSSEHVVRGFVFGCVVMSVYVILLFIYSASYKAGAQLFLDPQLRTWGNGRIMDWPNSICIILMTAFLLCVHLNIAKWLTYLLLFAAIVTTSRSWLVGLGALLLVVLWKWWVARRFGLLAIVLLVALAGAFGIYVLSAAIPDEILGRLLKSDDRLIVYSTAVHAIHTSPLIGIGSVDFGVLSNYVESFHNSYLKIATRFGVLGLICFLVLLIPTDFKQSRAWGAIGFVLLVSVVQDTLSHPHMLMLYSVLAKATTQPLDRDLA